jgi:hypothetical protein
MQSDFAAILSSSVFPRLQAENPELSFYVMQDFMMVQAQMMAQYQGQCCGGPTEASLLRIQVGPAPPATMMMNPYGIGMMNGMQGASYSDRARLLQGETNGAGTAVYQSV